MRLIVTCGLGRRIVRGLAVIGMLGGLLGCGLVDIGRPSPTPVSSPTPSPTPAPPSVTPMPSSPTPTETATLAPSATATLPPSATLTETPPATPEVTTPPAPAGETVEPACVPLPQGPFLAIWEADPARQATLGCPTSLHPRIDPIAWEVSTSHQPFERGAMLWSDKVGWYEQPVVYVLYETGIYERYDDTYATGDPGPDATPPAGLLVPGLGFGKVWDDHADVRNALGWATAPEMAGPGRFQLFDRGAMIWLSQLEETTILINEPSTYTTVPTSEFVE